MLVADAGTASGASSHGGGRAVVQDRVRLVAEDSVLLREGPTRLLTDRG